MTASRAYRNPAVDSLTQARPAFVACEPIGVVANDRAWPQVLKMLGVHLIRDGIPQASPLPRLRMARYTRIAYTGDSAGSSPVGPERRTHPEFRDGRFFLGPENESADGRLQPASFARPATVPLAAPQHGPPAGQRAHDDAGADREHARSPARRRHRRRAQASHGRGRRFEPCTAHQKYQSRQRVSCFRRKSCCCGGQKWAKD
jgi:hypothetical protein